MKFIKMTLYPLSLNKVTVNLAIGTNIIIAINATEH